MENSNTNLIPNLQEFISLIYTDYSSDCVPLLLPLSPSSVLNLEHSFFENDHPLLSQLHWYFSSVCLNPPKLLIPKFKVFVILKTDPSSSENSGLPQGNSSLYVKRRFPLLFYKISP